MHNEAYGQAPPEVRYLFEAFHEANLYNRVDGFWDKRANRKLAYRTGVIPADLLEDGEWYWGINRNCNMGQWDAARRCFRHKRYKWGQLLSETSQCLEADDGFALFFPVARIVPVELTLPQRLWNNFLTWCYQ